MQVISSALVFALCCLVSTTFALNCFQCELCGDEGHPISTNCSAGKKCAKFTMNYPKTGETMVFKGCMRDNGNCEAHRDTLGKGMMEKMFNEGKTAKDLGPLKLSCDYCTTDNCNGASHLATSPLFMGACLAAAVLTMRQVLH